MEEKLLSLYKLIRLQVILGVLGIVPVRILSFIYHDHEIVRRMLEITIPIAILIVNLVISYVIHSMRDKDDNFKMISVMCFFAGVFYMIRALRSSIGMVTIPGCIAMAFTAVYVIGFSTLMIKLFMTRDPHMAEKWTKYRKAFVIILSVAVISLLLMLIPGIDIFAFAVFALVMLAELVSGVIFMLLIRDSSRIM